MIKVTVDIIIEEETFPGPYFLNDVVICWENYGTAGLIERSSSSYISNISKMEGYVDNLTTMAEHVSKTL